MTDAKYTRQTVTAVDTWVADKLFSLRTTRDAGYVYQAGQFARLGLPALDDPEGPPTLWRAYSMVTAPGDEGLEFYSIVVPDGEFSPRLAALQAGDAIYIDKTPFGFLTLDRFEPEGDLWLLATGTGLSAYMSLLRDPETWRRYRRIVLVHGVRHLEELAYADTIRGWRDAPVAPYAHEAGAAAYAHGHTQSQAQGQANETSASTAVAAPAVAAGLKTESARLVYLPIATREPSGDLPQARLTTLIEDGRLETLAGLPLDPARAKIMLCGNPEMLSAARKLLAERGFAPGRRGIPGNLAVENYW